MMELQVPSQRLLMFLCLLTLSALEVRGFGYSDNRRPASGLLGSHFGYVGISKSFDYLVIGGGTAGLTIANRLAQNSTVAVIEAGGFYQLNNGNLTDIPADASYYLGKDPFWANPLNDWRQMTTPQYGLEGKSVLFPQGRTLGGGSARNFMWYQRGSTNSYQKWAETVGDRTYAFPHFLDFFKRSVNLIPAPENRIQNATPMVDTQAFNKNSGPLQVSWPVFASPAATWISKGLDAIGLKQVAGMADGNLLGWTWVAQTIDKDQVRSTSETSFLREALDRNDNLVVYQSTLAKKIIFNGDKKATGVVVETAGIGSGSVSWTLNATAEVIVSSGAFRSPQMLMVSGVGPKSTLEGLGIPVLADRPGVGQGMWDHLWFGPSYAVNTVTHSWLADPEYAAEATQQYIQDRTGILTNVGGDLLAFEKLPYGAVSNRTRADLDKNFGGDWPDIEILSLDAYTGTLNDYLLGAPSLDNFTAVGIVLVAPFSRGNVTIKSNDTLDHPIVDPNWLADPRDQEVAVAGFKRARAIFSAPEVRPILKGSEAYPGEQVQTDADILSSIRKSSDTIHHPAGTCRMGKAGDPMAVVDAKARVIGVQGLRVVDASAFPLLPPGHPQSTVYALAEKIATDILNNTS